MLKLSLNSFREEAIALVAGLVVFAVYYPLAVWVHRDFVSIGRPEGKVVELVLSVWKLALPEGDFVRRFNAARGS